VSGGRREAGGGPLPLDLVAYAFVPTVAFGVVARVWYLASGRGLVAPFAFHALTNDYLVHVLLLLLVARDRQGV
jgi:hypothetical protein